MFKNLLDRGGCLVGRHQGDWSYHAQDDCTQIRVCKVCQTEQQRTEHQWDDWLNVAGHPCAQSRRCGRCGQNESKVEHQGNTWVYTNDASCDQVQLCDRCHEKGTETHQVHEWGAWVYEEAMRSPA